MSDEPYYLSPSYMGGGERVLSMIGPKMPAGQHRLNIGDDDENGEDVATESNEDEFTHYLHLGDGSVVKAKVSGHPGNLPTTHKVGKTVHHVVAVAPREYEDDE